MMSEQVDYQSAQHAMQTGVNLMGQYEPGETRPKSLRVGINTALCDHAALACLLIEKGIITEGEYMAAITEEMNREVRRYEERIQRHLGGPPELELR